MTPAPSLLQRALLALLPALILVSVAVSAVWGDNGLLARAALRADLAKANAELASVERDNEHLLRELHRMDEDPLVRERMVAEELGWGRAEARIYRFED